MGLDDAIFDCIHDLKKGESERGKNQFINDLVWYAVSYLEDEIHGEDQKQLVKELEEKYNKYFWLIDEYNERNKERCDKLWSIVNQLINDNFKEYYDKVFAQELPLADPYVCFGVMVDRSWEVIDEIQDYLKKNNEYFKKTSISHEL